MASSITQFTRGPTEDPGRNVWKQPSPNVDRTLPKESEGIMDYYGLTASQKTLDSLPSPNPLPSNGSSPSPTETLSVEENGSDLALTDSRRDGIDLREMYKYACRLMRETLDIEGVCIIDIDWHNITRISADSKSATDMPSNQGRIFDSSSRVLGYSHSRRFGAFQSQNWPPIERWDEETSISFDPIKVDELSRKFSIDKTKRSHSSRTTLMVGNENLPAGRLGDDFVAGFLSEYVSGKIFNHGLPEAVANFLPLGVANVILVPLYDFDRCPFAITWAYSTNKHKKFLEEERRYLEVVQVRLNLILGIWVGYIITGTKGTNHYGRSIERNFHLKHFPRTTFSSPRYTRLDRILVRHVSEHTATDIHRLDRLVRSHSPRSHQSCSRLR